MDLLGVYDFRQATLDDVELLREWQSRPHVTEWWDPDDLYDQKELADPRIARWIVLYKGRPFAFLQDYAVHGWASHPFEGLPQGSRGIDQYIGEPDMVGVGHGFAFIGQHMRALFDAGVPLIGTDPDPRNRRAIAVYRKLGFKVSGPEQDTEWGRILPMTASRDTSGRKAGSGHPSRSG